MATYALTGDVGGTCLRLGLCSLATGEVSQAKIYSSRECESLDVTIRQYLMECRVELESACIAIACPVTEDQVALSRHSWTFSISEMKQNLGLCHLDVINDFTAMSMAIPMLQAHEVIQFGGISAQEDKPIAVYGPGTGLGVAHLMYIDSRWLSLPGEGGHMDFAPGSEEEDDILQILRTEWGHVSAERVLCGSGLVNLSQAIAKINGRQTQEIEPQEVTERALAGSCIDCYRALSLFCIILGRFGGNLALNLGTFGGVYIAGGIVPRFIEFFRASGFRAAFEDKGHLSGYLHDIPVFMVTHPLPGLLGAGAYLRQRLGIPLPAPRHHHQKYSRAVVSD